MDLTGSFITQVELQVPHFLISGGVCVRTNLHASNNKQLASVLATLYDLAWKPFHGHLP